MLGEYGKAEMEEGNKYYQNAMQEILKILIKYVRQKLSTHTQEHK